MNATNYRPTSAVALILSPDPLGGALVGAAIELCGIAPEFPRLGEPARDAVRRIRPRFVLLDCQDGSAADEALLGPAMMIGARVFLFGDATHTQRMQHVAIRFHLGVIVLPRDVGHLASVLALPSSSSELLR